MYAAAVTAQPRHTAVGGGKVHRKAVQRVGHSDVCGGKRGAGLLVVFGTVRVELGQVVPAGLHRPDLIPLGAERLFAVGLHADVDQQRSAVPVERYAAHIVVVVAVGVAAGLAAQCIGPAAADENADAGVPDIVRSGGGGGFCKVGDLALGHCGLDVVEQVDALAVVGVVQTVRVGVRGQYGGPVAGGQRHQRQAAHPFAEQVLPHAAGPGQRAAVGKVQVIRPGNVHVDDVLGHVPDLRLGPDVVKDAGGHFAQQVQRVEHRQRGVAVILCALAAAAVVTVVLQKAVDAVGGLLHIGGQILGRDALGGGQQYVLGTPGRPVAHRLVAVAHPPEVRGAVGRQHAALDLAPEPCGQPGGVGVERLAQQAADGGDQCAGLGGEQVYNGPGHVGQRQLRRVADIAVVGGQLPGALLTDAPGQVGQRGQIGAAVRHGLGHGQRAERAAAGKVGVLPLGAVPAAGELQPQRERQLRRGLGVRQRGLPGSGPAGGAGQALPRGAVRQRREQDRLCGLKRLLHLLRQHTIPSFSACTPGG